MTVSDGETSQGDDVGDEEESDLVIISVCRTEHQSNTLIMDEPDNNDPAEIHWGHRQARSSNRHVWRGERGNINHSYFITSYYELVNF